MHKKIKGSDRLGNPLLWKERDTKVCRTLFSFADHNTAPFTITDRLLYVDDALLFLSQDPPKNLYYERNLASCKFWTTFRLLPLPWRTLQHQPSGAHITRVTTSLVLDDAATSTTYFRPTLPHEQHRGLSANQRLQFPRDAATLASEGLSAKSLTERCAALPWARDSLQNSADPDTWPTLLTPAL